MSYNSITKKLKLPNCQRRIQAQHDVVLRHKDAVCFISENKILAVLKWLKTKSCRGKSIIKQYIAGYDSSQS